MLIPEQWCVLLAQLLGFCPELSSQQVDCRTPGKRAPLIAAAISSTTSTSMAAATSVPAVTSCMAVPGYTSGMVQPSTETRCC
jgi:hypothetical protein